MEPYLLDDPSCCNHKGCDPKAICCSKMPPKVRTQGEEGRVRLLLHLAKMKTISHLKEKNAFISLKV